MRQWRLILFVVFGFLLVECNKPAQQSYFGGAVRVALQWSDDAVEYPASWFSGVARLDDAKVEIIFAFLTPGRYQVSFREADDRQSTRTPDDFVRTVSKNSVRCVLHLRREQLPPLMRIKIRKDGKETESHDFRIETQKVVGIRLQLEESESQIQDKDLTASYVAVLKNAYDRAENQPPIVPAMVVNDLTAYVG